MTRILVTGSEGFIGSHLVRALVAEGHEVTRVDTLEPQVHGDARAYGDEEPDGVIVSYAGSLFPDQLSGFDAIVHLAARVGVGQAQYEPDGYYCLNSQDTASLWKDIINLPEEDRPKRFIVASSMSLYGEGPEGRGVREDDPVTVPNVYALTKYDQERLSLILGEAHGVPACALRFFNVYGEGQALSNPYTGVAAMFAARLLHGKGGLIYEDGRQTRDFIHVSDIVSGILAALRAPDEAIAGEVFNLGTGQATDLLTLHTLLAEALGVGHIEPCVTGATRSGDIRHCYSDPSKAYHCLGWSYSLPVWIGVRDYAAWLKQQDTRAINERVEAAWNKLREKGLVS
jgi:dTDP-L-rhamnose 4-epimerase